MCTVLSLSTVYEHTTVLLFLLVPPSPANFTPVKLEHAEQLELGYMPLRDDFEKVCTVYCHVLPRAYKEKRACNSQCILCMRRITDESAGYAIFSHDLANRPLGNKG